MWDCRWMPSFAGLLFWSGQVDAPPARSLFWGSVKQIAWSDRLSLPSNVNNKTGHTVGHGPLLVPAQTSGLLKGNTKQTDSPGQVTWEERHLDPRSPKGLLPHRKGTISSQSTASIKRSRGASGCMWALDGAEDQTGRKKDEEWWVRCEDKPRRSGWTDDLWPQADEKGGKDEVFKWIWFLFCLKYYQ